MASDSGSIVVLQYCAAESRFVTIQNEIFGKTGIRRIVPGQYLACDPKGRAVMIGAIEKQKLVYIFARWPNFRLLENFSFRRLLCCYDQI